MSAVRTALVAVASFLAGWVPCTATAKPNPFAPFELVIQVGHSAPVSAIAFSGDSGFLASSGGDYSIRLWSVPDGFIVRKMVGSRSLVRSLVYDDDDGLLYSAEEAGTVSVWESDSGRLVRRLDTGFDRLLCLSLSPRGFDTGGARLLLTGGVRASLGAVKVWDAVTGILLGTLEGHRGAVTSVGFVTGTNLMYTVSTDRTVRLWKSSSGRLVSSFVGNVATPVGYKGWMAVAGRSDEQGVKVFSITSQRVLKVFAIPGDVWTMCSLAGSSLLALNRDPGVLELWDVDASRKRWTAGAAGEMVFSRDGRYLAAGADDGGIKLFKPDDGRVMAEFEGSKSTIHDIEFSPKGDRIAVASGDGTTWVFETATGIKLRKLMRHSGKVTSVSYAPNDRFVATVGDDGKVLVFDTIAGKLLASGKPGSAGKAMYSPDGRWLAVVAGGVTMMRNALTGKVVSRLAGRLLGFSASAEEALMMGAGGRLFLVHLEDKSTRNLAIETECASLSPSGDMVAAAEKSTIRLVDARSGKVLRNLSGCTKVLDLAWSGDETRLAAGCKDGASKIWNVRSGAEVAVSRQSGAVRAVAFSPDGTLLAAGGDAGLLTLWNSRNGEPVYWAVGLGEHEFACVRPDGRLLYSSDAERYLRFTIGEKSMSLKQALMSLEHPELVAPIE